MCVHTSMYACAPEYGEENYLWWNHTSTHDKDIWPSQGIKFFDQLRNEGFMTSSKCADTDSMDICIDGLLRNFTGSLSTRKAERSGYNQVRRKQDLLHGTEILLSNSQDSDCALLFCHLNILSNTEVTDTMNTNAAFASGTGIYQLGLS